MRIFIALTLLLGAACQRTQVIDDLNDASFELVNQDSVSVTFPDDFKGKYVVMGFVYTNCPDICPLITQNMIKIKEELGSPDDVHFLGFTFDPERDTPAKLSEYKSAFRLDENFDFITGDTTTVSALMDSLRVRTQVSFTTTTEAGDELYFLNHSDKIMVMDPKSRVIIEYGGSQPMVPNLIVEDFQKIRR
ncbi:MAG: SCO family protein [Balneolaceae bacterium]|nr:SCO family protein [Balneolaceae bacterium]